MTTEAAQRYEALYGLGTYGTWVWELEKAQLADAVRKHLPLYQTRIRFLDFACGTGRVLAFLEPLTTEATGVDISDTMLAVAKQRVRSAKLVCADMTRRDIFARGSCDLVTAFRFFLNAAPALREEALTAIRRVLADEGIFITNIHMNLLSLRLIGYLFRRYVQRQELRAMSLWEMKRLLACQGFVVVEVVGVGWATPQMYRFLGRRWCDWIERRFCRAPVLSYLAGTLIFVCRKAGRNRE